MKISKPALALCCGAVALYLVAPFLIALVDFTIVYFSGRNDSETIKIEPIPGRNRLIIMIPNAKQCIIGNKIECYARSLSHHNPWLIDGYTITKINENILCRWKGTCGPFAILNINNNSSTNVNEEVLIEAFKKQYQTHQRCVP
jgi:hypothetical protein